MNTNKEKLKSVFEWLDSLILSISVIVLVFVFIGKVYFVNGSSMYPTLISGQTIIISGLFYTPKQGDIIVVDNANAYDESLVKRIIATENQVVDILEDGTLTVDGIVIDKGPGNVAGDVEFPIVVPEGCCFLMGDNRAGSLDSRFGVIGFAKNSHIMGKVIYAFEVKDR